jgi:hypothetical protein
MQQREMLVANDMKKTGKKKSPLANSQKDSKLTFPNLLIHHLNRACTPWSGTS